MSCTACEHPVNIPEHMRSTITELHTCTPRTAATQGARATNETPVTPVATETKPTPQKGAQR